MKKILAVLLILCSAFSLFAYTDTIPGTPFDSFNKAFMPTDAANSTFLNYALFKDPTALRNAKFSLVLPSVSLTAYNISAFLQSEAGSEFASKLVAFDFENLKPLSTLTEVVMGLGVGRNDIVNVDVNLGMTGKNWALGVDARVVTDSLLPTGLADIQLRPLIDGAASLAFNINLMETKTTSLDAALATRFAYRATPVTFISVENFEEITDFENYPFYAGWAVPVDVAVRASFLSGALSATVSAANLNGIYYMSEYQNLKNAIIMKDGEGSFEKSTPWSLNFALTLEPEIKVLKPVIRAELVDIYNLIKNKLDEDETDELMAHVNLSAKVRLFGFLDASAALNAGYWQFGAGFNFSGNSFTVLYGWHEAGSMLGYKPVDSLTIRFSLGYDGN